MMARLSLTALRPSLRAPHFVGPPEHRGAHEMSTATYPEGAPEHYYHLRADHSVELSREADRTTPHDSMTRKVT
jgi:hypothetical protein